MMPDGEGFEGLLGPVSEPAVSSLSAQSGGIMDAFNSDDDNS